ncbi:S9 family peptidase, partial [Burkholderia pseudomallei]
LSSAPVLFRGALRDISVGAQDAPLDRHHAIVEAINFSDANTYRLAEAGAWARYDVPPHVDGGSWSAWLLLPPRLAGT